jgi:hypothetical protein
MIRQFRKKPATIEAVQIDGPESVQPIVEWMNNATIGWQTNPPTIWIDELGGRITAKDGDWIVRGTYENFTVIPDHIFIRTYQEV